MESYVIAIRREARDKAPPGWQELLQDIQGLTIHPAANPSRIQVEASAEAIERVRQLVGGFCHIEPVIYHSKA